MKSLSPLVIWLVSVPGATAQTPGSHLTGPRTLKIERGLSKDAAECIACHSRESAGIVEAWKLSVMGRAGISCFDCHVVEKRSPMAIQCRGLRGTSTYISPMVSAKTCGRCYPQEAEQFSKSGHARLASAPVCEKDMEELYNWRMAHGEIEELSHVMNSGPQ